MTRAPLAALLLSALAFAADAPKPSATPAPLVAILYFDVQSNDQKLQVLKKGLAQMMISDLSAAEGIRVLERERLEDLLAELKLQQGAMVDKATAAQVGKLAGARYLVTGSVIEAGKNILFEARAIRLETGDVLKPEGGKPMRVKASADDVYEAEQELSGRLSELLSKAEALAPPAPKKTGVKLKLSTALKYAEALDAKDKKDPKTAADKLKAVVKDQPDFVLAALDLDRLVK
ncbi:MAG: hypothetical protein K1X89_02870 [Myxococcaceae bacterium]|nr:hypothetical protein [Myxococcaceae bacterium]